MISLKFVIDIKKSLHHDHDRIAKRYKPRNPHTNLNSPFSIRINLFLWLLCCVCTVHTLTEKLHNRKTDSTTWKIYECISFIFSETIEIRVKALIERWKLWNKRWKCWQSVDWTSCQKTGITFRTSLSVNLNHFEDEMKYIIRFSFRNWRKLVKRPHQRNLVDINRHYASRSISRATLFRLTVVVISIR